jgi:hypothetical protein
MLMFYAQILLLCLTLLPASAIAQTYFVRPTAAHGGDNSGTSYANAWQGLASIDWTSLASSPPNVLTLCGTFTTPLSVGADGANDAARITITGQCSGGTPGRISISSAHSYGISVRAHNFVKLEYIDVIGPTNTTNYPNGSIVTFDSNHVTFTRITARDNSLSNGFHIRRSTHVLLENVVATNNHGHGIYLTGDWIRPSEFNEISHCLSYNNGRSGVKFEGISSQSTSKDNSVHECDIYGNGDGIYLMFGARQLVHHNHIHDNRNTSRSSTYAEGYGIGIQQTSDSQIYSNRIAYNRSDGIEIWGDATISANNIHVFKNIIEGHAYLLNDDAQSNGLECRTGFSNGALVYSNLFINNTKAMRLGNDSSGMSKAFNNTVIDATYGVRFCSGSSGCGTSNTGWDLKNNIFSSVQYGIYTNNSAVQVTRANNLYDVGSVRFNGATYSGASIRTFEPSALVGAALLNPDSTPQAASPAVSAGTWIGAYSDAKNCPFNSPPTVGAYEKCKADTLYSYQ